jgi:hypothetical protein
VSLAEQKPFEIFVQFFAPHSPRQWFDKNFLPVAFDMFAK